MVENIPSLDDLVQKASDLFKNFYDGEPSVIVQAPGRVNIIGEHTDYNEGFVLPMALPLRTVIVGRPICGFQASITSIASEASGGTTTYKFNVNKEALTPEGPKWTRYVKGVLANYKGGEIPAFQAAIVNSVPIGGGLSSSASLEVATYMFLDGISGEKSKVSKIEKALACQKAEHEYAGMPCGIMDQFIALLGEDQKALLLDCRDMSYKMVPIDDPNVVILITNSNVKHSLTGSEYPTRRKQCHEAAQLLGKKSLRECTMEDINNLSSLGASEDHIKRARHVISEISRTENAARLFSERKYEEAGKLMVDSHNSLRHDFDVSCTELDELVEYAMEVEGVFGSRMTGGGFGGCTVTMVQSNAVDAVVENIRKNYKLKPTFFICKPSQGAGVIKGYTKN